MKKVISTILFFIVIVILLFDACFLIYGILDINRTLSFLASTPGTSGVDYLGLGWALGIGLFFLSAVGLMFSIIVAKTSTQRMIKNVTYITIIVFVLLLFIGIVAFYI